MSSGRPTAGQQRLVRARARGCCEYCLSQERFSVQPFAVEHIIPRSQGGETALDNLALSCQGCNNHKYAKTRGQDPKTGRRVRLFHPRKQRWGDHFIWRKNFTRIAGRTAIGRATVEELRLNREGLVNLRRALRTTDEHPPPEPSEGA